MTGIANRESGEGLTAEDLAPFFVGWSTPPGPDRRLEILLAADEVIVGPFRQA